MKKSIPLTAVCLAGLILAVAATRPAFPHGEEAGFGVPGDPTKPAHTVRISMIETTDGHMRFTPSDMTIRRGEQIRFLIENKGVLAHELIIDTVQGNLAHGEEMKKNPEMEHADPNGIRLAPTKRGEILWQFTEAGTFDFSCLIPGHRDAGMHGVIRVR